MVRDLLSLPHHDAVELKGADHRWRLHGVPAVPYQCDASAHVRFRPIWRFQSLCAWLWHYAGHQLHLRGPSSRGPDVVSGYRWSGQSRRGDEGHMGELSVRKFHNQISPPTIHEAQDTVHNTRE